MGYEQLNSDSDAAVAEKTLLGVDFTVTEAQAEVANRTMQDVNCVGDCDNCNFSPFCTF